MATLYAYLNRPTRTALLHDAICPSCNGGRGIHVGTPEAKELLRNGMWIELPGTLDFFGALRFARDVIVPALFGKGNKWAVRACHRCGAGRW